MPTGYTSELEKDWDVKKWLRQTVCRGLSFCIAFRDDGKLTARQIAEKLAEPDSDYWTEKKQKAEERLKQIASFTRKDWQKEFDGKLKNLKIEQKKNNADRPARLKKLKKYSRAVESVKVFLRNADTEGGKGVARFALDQLNACKDDYDMVDYFAIAIKGFKAVPLDMYIQTQKTAATADFECANKYYKEEVAWIAKRSLLYQGLLKDIENFKEKR